MKLCRMLLLGACLSAPGVQAATTADFTYENSPSYETSTIRTSQTTTVSSTTMPYRLYKAQGYDLPANATRTYPLIIWLHGSGERYNQSTATYSTWNTSQLNNGVVELANNTNQAYDPAFIMAPQITTDASEWFGGETRGETFVNERRLILAVQDMKTRFRIDPDRIYVMGLSMGGKGAFDMAMLYPDLIAASVPMSLGSSGNLWSESLLANMPVWSHCGSTDGYKGLNETTLANIRSAGGATVYSLYHNYGHTGQVWRAVAENIDVYKWMMAQRRLFTPTGVPRLLVATPSAGPGYTTASSSVTLSGTATLAASTMGTFYPVTYSLNGGTAFNATGTASWTTGAVTLGSNYNFVQALASVTQLPGYGLTTTGTTSFNQSLMINDLTLPTLTVSNPTTGTTYVSPTDSLTIRGAASDNYRVNEIGWTNSAGGSGVAGAEIDNPVTGQVTWIIRKIPLQAGTNSITISAFDVAGNAASKTIDVFRSANGGGNFFRQDFNSSATLSSYVSASPNTPTEMLNEIAAQANGGTWSIDGGALKIVRSSGTNSNAVAGFMRRYPLDGPPNGVMVVSFDLALSTLPSNYSNIASLAFGNYAASTSLLQGQSYAGTNTKLDINIQGNNVYTFRVNNIGENITFAPDLSTFKRVRWFINSSGVSKTYLAPDGSTKTLADNKSDVWADNTWVVKGATKNSGYGSRELRSFVWMMQGADVFTMKVDNLTCSDFETAPSGDIAPPTITISSPAAATTTTLSTVSLAGTAADNVGVNTVTWTNSTGGSGTATGTNSWSISNVALQPGANVITVTARDVAANSASAAVTVTYSPLVWTGTDIGSSTPAGSYSLSGSVMTVSGGGTTMSGNTNQHYYVYQSVSGDCTITARVATMGNSSNSAKAGVMIRDGLAENGGYVTTHVLPSWGGGGTSHPVNRAWNDSVGAYSASAPYWMRLKRQGAVFTSYASPDGATWTTVGTYTNTMATAVTAGVFSHSNASILNTATFDNISITTP